MSNRDKEVFVRLGLRGGPQFASQLKQFADRGIQSAKQLAGAWAKSGKALSDTGALLRKTALFVGGTAVLRQAIRDVTEFERGLTEMRMTAGMTAGEMDKVRKQILDLSKETLQLPEDQLAAFRDMVAAGIDPTQAITGLRAMNRTATASFSDIRDIAASSVDLFQKMKIAPEELERAFNIMSKAGKEGRFELKDMAGFFPAITSDAAKFGLTGEKGLAQMTAMLQISRKGTADASTAANNMRNFFAKIITYREQLGKAGIRVFDFVDVKTGKFKEGKGFDEFFGEIMKKTGGSSAKLQMAGFRDIQAMDFVTQMMANWKEYQRIRDEALSSAGADVVGKDFNTVADTSYARLKKLEIAQSKAMKSGGSSWFAEKAGQAGNWAIENPMSALGLAAGGLFGYKALKNFAGRKFGGAMGGGAGIGGLGAPMPVYVVNKHLSMLPGQGWGFPGGGAPGVPGGAGGGKMMGLLGKAGLVGGVGAAAYGVGSLINMGIDKMFGEKGGLGSWLYDVLHQPGSQSAKNNINLSVRVDKDGRVITDSNDTNTKIKLKRGNIIGD